MKLYYRGLSFEYDPAKVESQKKGQQFKQVRESQPAYNLIYRGVTYTVDPNAQPTEVPAPPEAYELSYRGITYLVNRNAQGKVTVVSQPASTPKFETPSVPKRNPTRCC